MQAWVDGPVGGGVQGATVSLPRNWPIQLGAGVDISTLILDQCPCPWEQMGPTGHEFLRLKGKYETRI